MKRITTLLKMENILDLLNEDDARSYTSIGNQIGVSREYVRQVAATIGDTGRRRQKLRIARQHRMNRLAAQRIAPQPGTAVRRVWDAAREAGLPVERVPVAHRDGRYLYPYLLRIGGKLVVVKRSSLKFAPSGSVHSVYGRFQIRKLWDADFIALVTCVPDYPHRIFVIPANLLAERHMAYVPLWQWPVYRGILPRIPWWDHENAWHLLKPVEDVVYHVQPGGRFMNQGEVVVGVLTKIARFLGWKHEKERTTGAN